MTSDHPAIKRRRLGNAAQKLTKPFVSPLKATPQSSVQDLHPLNSASEYRQLKSAIPATSQANKDDETCGSATRSPARTRVSASCQPTLKPRLPSTSVKTTQRDRGSSPRSRLKEYQSQHASLLRSLSEARSRLETSQQALAIEKSASSSTGNGQARESCSRDEELKQLSIKWRLASRDAAEELFRDAKDRVNKMGGMRGLKEREREKKQRQQEWLREEMQTEMVKGKRCTDEDRDGAENTGMEDETSFRSGHDDQGRSLDLSEYEEDLHGREGRNDPLSDGNEDGGYTMDMMLATLNVDLDTIGFDKDQQRWTDCI